MMHATIVDRLHGEFSEILDFLKQGHEISLHNVADENLKKTLLIASASYFEQRLTEEVNRFVEDVTAKDHVLTHLVYNKAVDRQYHSWFDWKARNANQFFVLFGTDCKNYMKTEVDKDEDLKSSIRAFLEIGLERNRLAHQDFGSYSLEKQSEEVYELHKTAMRFVEWFPSAIRKFSNDA